MSLLALLGMGLAYTGGAQYLLKAADTKQVTSLLDGFVSQLPGGEENPYNELFQRQAQQIMADEGGFLDAGRSDEAKSLLDLYNRVETGYYEQQQAQQAAAQQAWQQSNAGILQNVWEQNQANQERFGSVQEQGRIIDELYNGGDLSAGNLNAMINAVARMQFPDEALNEGDIARVMAGSSWYTNFANQIAKLGGKADPALAQEIYNVGRDLYQGYKSSFDASQRNVDQYIASERERGYLTTDRAARRFGAYDPNFVYGPAAGVPAPVIDTEDPDTVPTGFTTINPNARGNSGSARRERRGY